MSKIALSAGQTWATTRGAINSNFTETYNTIAVKTSANEIGNGNFFDTTTATVSGSVPVFVNIKEQVLNNLGIYNMAEIPTGTSIVNLLWKHTKNITNSNFYRASFFEYCPSGEGWILPTCKVRKDGVDYVAMTTNTTYEQISPTVRRYHFNGQFPATGALTAIWIGQFSGATERLQKMYMSGFSFVESASAVPAELFGWRQFTNRFNPLYKDKITNNETVINAVNPWVGKKIVWVGTSIPTVSTGSYGTELSYPLQVGSGLSATVINESVSGSYVTWDGTFEGINWQKSLAATKAEIMAHPLYAFGDELNSYEEKLIGSAADLVVFDHGHNDRLKSLGNIDLNTNKNAFYEAYNYLIEQVLADNPTVKFCFLTPPTYWTGGVNDGTIAAINVAIKALGVKYGASVIDMTNICGFNSLNHATYFTDTVHPNGLARTRIAKILCHHIKGV